MIIPGTKIDADACHKVSQRVKKLLSEFLAKNLSARDVLDLVKDDAEADKVVAIGVGLAFEKVQKGAQQSFRKIFNDDLEDYLAKLRVTDFLDAVHEWDENYNKNKKEGTKEERLNFKQDKAETRSEKAHNAISRVCRDFLTNRNIRITSPKWDAMIFEFSANYSKRMLTEGNFTIDSTDIYRALSDYLDTKGINLV